MSKMSKLSISLFRPIGLIMPNLWLKRALLMLALLIGPGAEAFPNYISSPHSGAGHGVGVQLNFNHRWPRPSQWSFGDGTFASSLGTVFHTYTTAGTYTVRLTCPNYNVGNGDNREPVLGGQCSITIHIGPLPVINSFGASASPIWVGQGSYLSWNVANVSTLSIDQGVGPVSTTPPLVKPTATTAYTLTATNPYGSATRACTVAVKPAPTITSFAVSSNWPNAGQSVALMWTVSGEGVSLSLDQGIGSVAGTYCTIQPIRTRVYTLTASSPSGSVSATKTVNVNRAPTFPYPISIPIVSAGQSINLVLAGAHDPERDLITTYGMTGLPNGLSFNPTTRTLSGSVAQPGAYRLTYTATDEWGAIGKRPLDLYVQAVGGSIPLGYTTSLLYGYDDQGRLSTLTYPSGRVVTYTYDSLDRVNQVTQDGQGVVSEITYDGWSNPDLRRFGSGAMDDWSYGPSGTRVETWVIGTVGGVPEPPRTYSYDAADRLIKAGEWNQLVYDDNSRLIHAEGFGLTGDLIHDAYNNNISSLTVSPGEVPPTLNNFTFNPMVDNHLPGESANGGMTQVSENNFGEITNLGTGITSPEAISMTWDALGRMASTSTQGMAQSYWYTASGLRVVRQDALRPELSRIYVYTSTGQALSEYTSAPSPAWARDVIYLGNLAIAEIDANGLHALHSDHLGSPRVITGAAGTVEGTQAYGPYGELIQQTGYIPLTGYTGHLQTEPIGLIYMRGRFFSPAWHRFMNSDQGVDPNNINQTAYVRGNPFMSTDPSGMECDGYGGDWPDSEGSSNNDSYHYPGGATVTVTADAWDPDIDAPRNGGGGGGGGDDGGGDTPSFKDWAYWLTIDLACTAIGKGAIPGYANLLDPKNLIGQPITTGTLPPGTTPEDVLDKQTMDGIKQAEQEALAAAGALAPEALVPMQPLSPTSLLPKTDVIKLGYWGGWSDWLDRMPGAKPKKR